MNKENTEVKKEKQYISKEEMQKIKKSDYYREDLAEYIGKKFVIECSFYEFKPYKEDRYKVCLRDAVVMDSDKGPQRKAGFENIEHIWVSMKKDVRVDTMKPLRVIGIPYEYAHQCGKTWVRNIGMNVIYVSQNTLSGII